MKLEALRRKSAYYREGPDWVRNRWPRLESLGWFIKANKDELTRQGAIVKLGREWFVDIDAFPAVSAAISGLNIYAAMASHDCCSKGDAA